MIRDGVAATVITGNSADLIQDALKSVSGKVATCFLIDTGVSDETIELANQSFAGPVHVIKNYWNNDFARLRNLALHLGNESNFEWLMTLDTDERFDWRDDANSLNKMLASQDDVNTWMLRDRSGSYAKERFFRLPCSLSWTGKTHEYIQGYLNGTERKLLPFGCFWEVPKNAEQKKRKLERDERILRNETAIHLSNSRWWFYLGQTQEDLDKIQNAIESYSRAAILEDWKEQNAWIRYCIVRCQARLGHMNSALKSCLSAIIDHPSNTDLLWIAAWCFCKCGSWIDAIGFAKRCIENGYKSSPSHNSDEYAFCNPATKYEAPFEILMRCYDAINARELFSIAERGYQEALRARESVI